MAILFNYFEVIVVVCELSKTMIRVKRMVNPKVCIVKKGKETMNI